FPGHRGVFLHEATERREGGDPDPAARPLGRVRRRLQGELEEGEQADRRRATPRGPEAVHGAHATPGTSHAHRQEGRRTESTAATQGDLVDIGGM
ncbi:unnamed protein product, partial [Lampetra fluviatilis]